MSAEIMPRKIDELYANHSMVSVHKYGFFLCRKGWARILLGSNTYHISRNHLCLYTPNTFFQILEKSPDLDGLLEEDDVDTYYPVVGNIDIRERLRIRNSPCVEISEEQATEIVILFEIVKSSCVTPKGNKTVESVHTDYLRYIRYAICLKVLEVYFGNTPIEAMPQSKEAEILNRFLISVYENCCRQRSVQFYANQQHLSPYYFSSIIKQCSGKSALQWIANVSMIFARQYLECTTMSVKEIADCLNFPDQSSFGRYFKHHEGITPTQFREHRHKING